MGYIVGLTRIVMGKVENLNIGNSEPVPAKRFHSQDTVSEWQSSEANGAELMCDNLAISDLWFANYDLSNDTSIESPCCECDTNDSFKCLEKTFSSEHPTLSSHICAENGFVLKIFCPHLCPSECGRRDFGQNCKIILICPTLGHIIIQQRSEEHTSSNTSHHN